MILKRKNPEKHNVSRGLVFSGVDVEGLELRPKPPGEMPISESEVTREVTFASTTSVGDSRLAEIISRWETLPETVRHELYCLVCGDGHKRR